jgi:hypothetical protein
VENRFFFCHSDPPVTVSDPFTKVVSHGTL